MALSDHSLVAHYMLTSDVSDLVGSYNGLSAQNMNFSYDSDIEGVVADFSSSYYGIDNALQNGFDTEYSVSFWIKPDVIGGGQKTIMANEQDGSYYNTFGINLIDDGRLYAFVRDGNGGSYDIIYTVTPLVAGQWHNLTLTWSGSELKWYLNGVLDNTASATRVPWNSPATMWVGANATKSNKMYFDGKMADIRFWYSELVAGDVSELYAAGAGPLENGQMAQYALDSDLVDSVGSFDGTNSGATFETAAGRSFASFDAADRAFLGTDFQFGAEDFTFSFWMNPEATQENYAMVFASYAEVYTGYYFVQDALNHNKYWFRGNGGSTWQPYSSTVDIPANSWTHVTIVRTGTTVSLYTNGSLAYQDTNAVASTISYGSSNPQLTLGGVSNSNAYNGWAGDLDDFRVWTRALDASEIATLYSDNVLLSDGLVAKYDLDSDAVDSVGSSAGVVTGAAFTSDLGRDAVFFDGSNDYINLGDRDEFEINATDSRTFSMWFKLDSSAASGYMHLLNKRNVSSNNNGWAMFKHSSNTIQFQLVSGGSGLGNIQTDSAVSNDTWYHIVVTVDRQNQIMKMYLDGVPQASTLDISGIGSVESTNPLYMGWGDNVAYFDGFMDDFRVWTRALDSGEVSTLYAETTVSDSGAYDWTFDGQLTNIVKFSRGFDASGNASYAYAKKEDDNTTTLYFATNLADYATFSMYNAAASSIDGSPVCMEYGPNGAVILGTDSGKVYKIELDGSSVPQSYTLLHSMVGGDRINSIGYGEASDVWLFEAGGVIHTVPNAGGGAVARHTLPAGAKIVDFAEGDSGAVAMIIRLADFSLEPRIATSDWGAVYGPSSMIAGIETGAITDFNYGRAIDTWVASSADGNTLITSSDLLQFLK